MKFITASVLVNHSLMILYALPHPQLQLIRLQRQKELKRRLFYQLKRKEVEEMRSYNLELEHCHVLSNTISAADTKRDQHFL